MKKKLKKIPEFKNEEEERTFWATHDFIDYVDFSKPARGAFPSLKLSTQTISLRLPASMLGDLKIMANKRDVPYQSLMKILLADAIRRERHDDKRK